MAERFDRIWHNARLATMRADRPDLGEIEHGLIATRGGRIVYATCSVLPEENETIVESFLAAHPKFALGSAAAELSKAGIALDTGPMLKVYPHRHGCDGFFAAVLERT